MNSIKWFRVKGNQRRTELGRAEAVREDFLEEVRLR